MQVAGYCFACSHLVLDECVYNPIYNNPSWGSTTPEVAAEAVAEEDELAEEAAAEGDEAEEVPISPLSYTSHHHHHHQYRPHTLLHFPACSQLSQ